MTSKSNTKTLQTGILTEARSAKGFKPTSSQCQHPYHFGAICVMVCYPGNPISWVRQLEGCGPFVSTDVSLSSSSTHFNCSSKINLEPVVIAAHIFGTPAITPYTVESTISGLVIFAITRRRGQPVIRYFGFVRNSYWICEAITCETCRWK